MSVHTFSQQYPCSWLSKTCIIVEKSGKVESLIYQVEVSAWSESAAEWVAANLQGIDD